MGTFGNPILGSLGRLIREAIQSANYVAGLAGWRIDRDGGAEFSSGTFRGQIRAASIVIPGTAAGNVSRIEIPTTLPAPLDTYTLPDGSRYTAAIIFYSGTAADSYEYIAVANTWPNRTEVHQGHVEGGAVVQQGALPAVFKTQYANDGSGRSYSMRGDGLIASLSQQLTLECAAGINILSDVILSKGISIGGVDISAPWTPYTPSWSADGGTQPSIGNGAQTGAYTRIGKTVHFRLNINPGTLTTYGVGNYSFGLPLPIAAEQVASAIFRDNSGATEYALSAWLQTGSTILHVVNGTGGKASSTVPVAWAAGDRLQVTGTYETV